MLVALAALRHVVDCALVGLLELVETIPVCRRG
jgi:hypothetical protein